MGKKSTVAPLRCLITAGPSFEPLDEVRRLTNFSTGTMGCNLADYLSERGHSVQLLLGHYATHKQVNGSVNTDIFTTSDNLRVLLHGLSQKVQFDAVFHAAAVSDFKFGQVFRRDGDQLQAVNQRKFSIHGESLLAELLPTEKILPKLREWYAQAAIFGWKYEVDGNRETALQKAKQQLKKCQTDASIPNGPAYGLGFGLVQNRKHEHFASRELLFPALEKVALRKRD